MEVIALLVIVIVIGSITASHVITGTFASLLFVIAFTVAAVCGVGTFLHWLVDTYDREHRLPGTLTTIFFTCICFLIIILQG